MMIGASPKVSPSYVTSQRLGLSLVWFVLKVNENRQFLWENTVPTK
jgi:hypothetical protein